MKPATGNRMLNLLDEVERHVDTRSPGFREASNKMRDAILDGVGIAAQEPDWKQIATDLYEALQSFMAYDGTGRGGAEDGNRGDWRKAENAELAYALAIGDG